MMNVQAPAVGGTTSSVFSVNNLTVTYEGEGKPTVRDCSLQVEQGEALLIVGPSGCGKSTLAMALAGIIPRSIEGTMTGRVDTADEIYHPGNIGYVFQDPDAQFCMLTVADEIAFGLENLGVSRDEMPERMVAALAEVGLDVPLDAKHATFSGGMKQKLAIACALALRPQLLILDEPTANLDPLATRQIFELLAALHQRGRTMILIEHKYIPLLSIVDKVVEMSGEGTIAQMANPASWQPFHDEVGRAEESDRAVSPKQNGTSGLSVRMGDPVIQLHRVGIQYTDTPVLADVSFALHSGEWVAIVGPNGAGKSSLLEVMGGLTPPSAGDVRLRGQPMAKESVRTRYQAISYGFQNPEYQFLYERVSDEMASRVVANAVPTETKQALAILGLETLGNHSPYSLSQGQKRRLAVGVMLSKPHDVYLFDEPTYGQDAKSEQIILRRLQALREEGKAIVTVTHDITLVRRYATRVIAIADGAVLYDGAVAGLFEREDVLTRAHLLDDIRPIDVNDVSDAFESPVKQRAIRQRKSNGYQREGGKRARSPMASMHPAFKLFSFLCVAVLTLFANNFPQVGRMWGLTLVVAFGLSWCRPEKLARRIWFILLLYLVSIWTFAANSAVPPGVHSTNVLWFHISLYGFWQGVLVSLRTLSTVVLAYVFLLTTDETDFVVSLSQTFAMTPKLSYGIMAGTGFLTRIEREMRIFRLARRIRGRSGYWVWRPVTYALPMLSQAIRTSERVATAMEARGFYGAPALEARARSFFRQTPLRRSDVWWCLAILFGAGILFWL